MSDIRVTKEQRDSIKAAMRRETEELLAHTRVRDGKTLSANSIVVTSKKRASSRSVRPQLKAKK
jgi:hypothetical protein